MLRSKRNSRGYTLAELLTVIVILALVMSAVVAFVGPLLRSHSQSQAKADTIQSAASAFYQLERDLRQSVYNQVWVCSTASDTCAQATASFNSADNAIVFPTAYQNGRGQFKLNPNVGPSEDQPYWQGVMVYWVDSNHALRWFFDAANFSVGSSQVSQSVAQQAVTDALASSNVTAIANNVQQLEAAKPGTNIISLQMQAQSTISGATNETTFNSTVLSRQ